MDNAHENYTMIERTILSLQCLYLNCKESQDLQRGNFTHSSQLAYAKEYCTIKLASSRGSGHSSAISSFLNHLTGQWLVLGPTQKQSERIHGLMRKNNATKQCKRVTNSEIEYDDLKVVFGSMGALKNGSLNGYEFDGVIFDGAFGIRPKDLSIIYSQLMASMVYKKYMFFIFIG
jgi:hypothetical protein